VHDPEGERLSIGCCSVEPWTVQVADQVSVSEGLEKVTRGGEWEPIKIPRENLAYVP
jgi:hypothetical protein